MISKSAFRLLAFIQFLVFQEAASQSYDSLKSLSGFKSSTYYSPGADVKALRMATQLDKVISFYTKHLDLTPAVTLLILSPEDWPKHTKLPVYGMPHYTSSQTLVVASENNSFWKSMRPPFEKMNAMDEKSYREIYQDQQGESTMEPFFDLLAIHELGHAYHNQGGLLMQRKWMAEFFCNTLLHTYIAENEPDLLSALVIFPRTVFSTTNKSVLKYTSLQELETFYNEIAQKYPQNYGWYQCRWHMAAATVYERGGITVLKSLWTALKKQRSVLDDADLIKLLKKTVHKSVADVPVNWDKTD